MKFPELILSSAFIHSWLRDWVGPRIILDMVLNIIDQEVDHIFSCENISVQIFFPFMYKVQNIYIHQNIGFEEISLLNILVFTSKCTGHLHYHLHCILILSEGLFSRLQLFSLVTSSRQVLR